MRGKKAGETKPACSAGEGQSGKRHDRCIAKLRHKSHYLLQLRCLRHVTATPGLLASVDEPPASSTRIKVKIAPAGHRSCQPIVSRLLIFCRCRTAIGARSFPQIYIPADWRTSYIFSSRFTGNLFVIQTVCKAVRLMQFPLTAKKPFYSRFCLRESRCILRVAATSTHT